MIRFRGFKVFALFLALAAFGCGKKQVVKPSEEAVKATQAVAVFHEMEKAYTERDKAALLKSVSKDFQGGYSELEARVRKDMETYSRVDLETLVERVEEPGEDVRVVFHWYGKWYDKAGTAHEGRGNSVFVFRAGPEMSLAGIVGDSPFGVVR